MDLQPAKLSMRNGMLLMFFQRALNRANDPKIADRLAPTGPGASADLDFDSSLRVGLGLAATSIGNQIRRLQTGNFRLEQFEAENASFLAPGLIDRHITNREDELRVKTLDFALSLQRMIQDSREAVTHRVRERDCSVNLAGGLESFLRVRGFDSLRALEELPKLPELQAKLLVGKGLVQQEDAALLPKMLDEIAADGLRLRDWTREWILGTRAIPLPPNAQSLALNVMSALFYNIEG